MESRNQNDHLTGILFNMVKDAVIVTDSAGHITSMNRSAELLTGYADRSYISEKFEDLIQISDAGKGAKGADFLQKLAKDDSGKDFTLPVILKNRNGMIYQAELRAARIEEPEGISGGIVYLLHNTTETSRLKDDLEALRLHFKKTEDRGQESIVLFKQILESTPDSVFAVDRNYCLIFLNQRQQETLAESGGEPCIPGKTVLSDTYPGEVLSHWRSLYNRAFNGEVFRTETKWKGREGQFRVGENNFAPLRDTTGTIIGALVVTHDITKRRQTEEDLRQLNDNLERIIDERTADLRESETRYRTIVETSGEGITMATPEGIINFANYQFSKMLGYEINELIGKSGFDIIFDDWKPEVHRTREKLETKESICGEFKFRRKDGSVLWTMYNSTPVFNNKGEHVANFAMHTDITRRKEVEAALSVSEEKYRLLIELVPVGIAIHVNGIIKTANSTGIRILGGSSEEEFIGKSIFGFIHPDYRASTVERINWSVKEKMIPPLAEIKLIKPGGEEITVLTSGTPIDYMGKSAMMIAIIDITENKLKEEELRRSKNEMQRLTSHIQEIREQEKKTIAGEIHDELGQRLAGVKMELSWVGLKCAGNNDITEKISKMELMIDACVDAIHQIIRNLRPPVLDDLGLTESISWLSATVMRHSGLEIDTAVNMGKTRLGSSDELAIFRVIQEALTNCIKHACATRFFIDLRIDDGEVKITLSDNGAGISRKSIVSHDSYGLMGMRERISSLNGTFNIIGSRGNGTTIKITIPVKKKGR